MKLNDLLSHLNNLVGIVANNWNFYSLVSIGIITAIAAFPNELKVEIFSGIKIFSWILLIGAILFFSSNFISLKKAIDELKVTEDQIVSKLKNDRAGLDKEFVNFYTSGHRHFNRYWKIFHIAIDALVLICISFRIIAKGNI